MTREQFTQLVRKELPSCWKHIIQIKDHKEILIPGGYKPSKDGWID